MEEFSARIIKIESIGNNEYKVMIDVHNTSEIEQIFNFEDSENGFVLHGNNYEFIIDKGKMNPIGDSEECMEVFSTYETSDNLNPRLRRQWLTGSIIDNISFKLITNSILKTYSTEDED